MGIGSAYNPMPSNGPGLLTLYEYVCGHGPNASDLTLGPPKWTPAHGGPCEPVASAAAASPALYVYESRAGPAAADLVPLELFYKDGDHYAVASAAGKADAAALGYVWSETLGYVWPAPGTANATSRYPLPAISKDDPTYIEQN
eukprot:7388890-Prymnesium_polylepis.2